MSTNKSFMEFLLSSDDISTEIKEEFVRLAEKDDEYDDELNKSLEEFTESENESED